MNTKAMHKHLLSSGCSFVKSNDGEWSCNLDGTEVASHRQLGQLVWIAARKLGED